MMSKIKTLMAFTFSGFFLLIAFCLVGVMVYQFAVAILSGEELTTTMLRAINTAVIALATFELGIGIGKEYTASDGDENIYSNVRRTVTRFFGVVCIALVLEGLIMVIKYSELQLAGNLYYPVAILLGAAGLLMALGVFLHLTWKQSEALHRLSDERSDRA